MRTHDVDRRAARALGHRRACLEELVAMVRNPLGSGSLSDDNHLGFMAYAFLAKQTDHATGILRLGDHPDSVLIARSMLEGMVQLLWAAKDSPARPLLWRAFAWVVDWRTMRAQEAAGEEVAPEQKAASLQQMKLYGPQFYTGAAKRKGLRQYIDPYRRDWYPVSSVRELFAETESISLHDELYVQFAEWHHWSPGAIGHALARLPGTITYNATRASMEARALACAFQCLHHTAVIADHALELGLADRLQGIAVRMVAGHEKGLLYEADGT